MALLVVVPSTRFELMALGRMEEDLVQGVGPLRLAFQWPAHQKYLFSD